VPKEAFFTLGMLFVLEKHGTITTKKYDYSPEKKHGK